MENHKIPNSALVASSRSNQFWGPERGRLNEKKDGSFNGGWISQFSNAHEFFQIDLGSVTKVTGIATQGRDDAGCWTKTYTIDYSVEGGTFQPYGKVLQGNTDHSNSVGRILDPPIIARFIKINVKTVQGHPSLRVELYGCTEGFSTPKFPQCMEALGMQNLQIPDSAITASSSSNAISFAPYIGRLHFLSAGSGKYGSWAAGANDENQWFQVDLGSWTKISAVATQGRQDANQWVKTFTLSFSYDDVFWETVKNEHNITQVFTANSDRYTVATNVLYMTVIIRYVRINPKSWHAHISMRAEIYGCRKGFEHPTLECQSKLGMKSGNIPDSAISATSSLNQYHGPERARLDTVKSGSFIGAWIPKTQDKGQWIQVDLEQITKITRIATQGRQDADQWVKRYSISYNVNGGPFLPYNNNKALPGNKDRNTIVGHILNPPIIARYIRIHPKEYYSYMALRFELYGCTEGFAIPQAPVCQIQLGMQNGKLPNSALSASSQLNANAGSENARLHFCAESGRYGAWVAQRNDHSQYYQVDFGIETQVTRIETQGRQDSLQYVKAYTLRYSTDGSYFKQYQPSGFTKTFKGNSDRYTVVGHDLEKPIRTRYLRIVPEDWHGSIALRAEFYGCETSKAEWKPVKCYKTSVRGLYEILNVKGNRIGRRFAACQSQANVKGITLFGMDDKRCWIGENADSKYSKYGISGLCQKTIRGIYYGLSEHDTMRVYMKDDNVWQDKGCYVNRENSPALLVPFETSVDKFQGNENIFLHCSEKAKSLGYTLFGVDDKNCWRILDDEGETYKQYGESSKCTVGKTGYGSGKEVNGDMFIYHYHERPTQVIINGSLRRMNGNQTTSQAVLNGERNILAGHMDGKFI